MKKVLLLITMIAVSIAGNAQQWEIMQSKDEFGDTTGATYMVNLASGTFSNSVTTNSLLTPVLFITDDACYIKLLEYGKYKANLNERSFVKLKVKLETGNTVTLRVNSQGTYLNFVNKAKAIELFKTNKILKFYFMDYSEYSYSTYSFTVNSINFNKVYNKFKSN